MIFIGAAVIAVLGWFVLLPTMPVDAQARTRRDALLALTLGLVVGGALWVVDRLRPDISRRMTGGASWVWYGVLGLLIFLGERAMVLASIGLLGATIPIIFVRRMHTK